jgi:predicted AlkP superfamily pyrophosphatase or phosphodiesterase
MVRRAWYGLILAAGLTLASAGARAASVLLISVDGLKPEYALQADTLQLKLPFLRGVIAQGAYAAGVTGVWPTVTYPSHTTLITGVAPAEHGIYNNLEFDPGRHFADSWFWYAAQIKVPTLWGAAHHAGLTTASVGWPVSVGNPDVDFLIPEYWRLSHPTDQLNPSDRHLIAALSRPRGMLESLEQSEGPYLMGNDTSVAGDEIKTRFAIAILRDHKPRFMTVHLSSLDEAEHGHGPFSPEANLTLEAIDSMLKRLAAAAREGDPAAIVAVVSDHGFVALTHRVNLYIPFIQAGLMDAIDSTAPAGPAGSWRAQPWLAGGMAAIMLRDPGDEGTLAKVHDLLNSLRADPRSGIDQVLEHDALAQRGAFPGASFLVVMKPGFYTGNDARGEWVTEVSGRGGHGFSPESPSMRAAFFVDGPGIAAHRALGLIDMRQIAPTVADLLGVPMPSAAAAPLRVRQ